jgi:2-haloacid dehalogenase
VKPKPTVFRYSWILFDADGTLFDYDAAEAAALAASFARIGHVFLPEHSEIYRTINGRMWLELEEGTTTQERLRIERFEKLFKAIGVNGDPVEFSDDYTAKLATQTGLIDGADSTVAALAKVAHLMLITNGLAEVQRPRFAASSIRQHFEGLVISEEVGAAKPDPRIFDTAFACMHHPKKSEVLMVGDSLTSDVKGGNDSGIDTCWFNPSGLPLQDGVEPTYEIRRIAELLDLCRGSDVTIDEGGNA